MPSHALGEGVAPTGQTFHMHPEVEVLALNMGGCRPSHVRLSYQRHPLVAGTTALGVVKIVAKVGPYRLGVM